MTKPAHLFVSSSDGHLYDTRKPEWHKGEPVQCACTGAMIESAYGVAEGAEE